MKFIYEMQFKKLNVSVESWYSTPSVCHHGALKKLSKTTDPKDFTVS